VHLDLVQAVCAVTRAVAKARQWASFSTGTGAADPIMFFPALVSARLLKHSAQPI
jgi:hypothetical protein